LVAVELVAVVQMRCKEVHQVFQQYHQLVADVQDHEVV
jgi:hypothetical protein